MSPAGVGGVGGVELLPAGGAEVFSSGCTNSSPFAGVGLEPSVGAPVSASPSLGSSGLLGDAAPPSGLPGFAGAGG